MSEKDFQQNVLDLARTKQWLVYHTFDSRRSEPGFPDLTLVSRKTGRVMFREIKTEEGKLTSEQVLWLALLIKGGNDADVWRPSDIEKIQKELSA